jgi:hypothetical protein
LAACDRHGATNTPSNVLSNAATTPANQVLATPTISTAPDPATDARPDSVKLADFLTRIETQRSSLAAADAGFLGQVRSAMETGSQANARIVLASYQTEIARELASMPKAPQLGGCFAGAAPFDDKAVASDAATLIARRGHAAEIAAIDDRPLSLPDFGALASDFAANTDATSVADSITSARSAAAGCRDGEAAPRVRRSGESATSILMRPVAPPSPTSVLRTPSGRFQREFR